jgi:CheY-like chemotaxis protein
MFGNINENKVWLIVEDDVPIRTMLSALVTLWGKVPLAFGDGYRAMAWLDQVQAGIYEHPLPELALLDVRMPGPKGYEIAHRMRYMAKTANIPVIIMTAFHLTSDEQGVIQNKAHPNLVLRKPLPHPSELRKLLEELIAVPQPR